MSEIVSPDRALGIAWAHFMRKGNFEDALLVSLLLKHWSLESPGNQSMLDANAFLLKTTGEILDNYSASKADRGDEDVHSCSFCGKRPPDVRLGAGMTAFICNECVEIFHNNL
jgi:hypothetical protein